MIDAGTISPCVFSISGGTFDDQKRPRFKASRLHIPQGVNLAVIYPDNLTPTQGKNLSHMSLYQFGLVPSVKIKFRHGVSSMPIYIGHKFTERNAGIFQTPRGN